MWTSRCSSALCWRDFLGSTVLPLLFRQRAVDSVHGICFWLPILRHETGCLFLPQHCTVLVTGALQEVVESGSVGPSTLFSFNIVLALLGLPLFIQTLEEVCPHFAWDCFQPVGHFKNWQDDNTQPSYPWTWARSARIQISDVLHQSFIIFLIRSCTCFVWFILKYFCLFVCFWC